jgi:hypothetical protein
VLPGPRHSLVRALVPAPRPVRWALLASLGAGWFVQSLLIAIVAAAGTALYDSRPAYTFAFALGALTAGFVAKASGGSRSAVILVAIGFFIEAAGAILLTVFPPCAPSAFCTPTAPLSAFTDNWPTDAAVVAGALLAIPLAPGPTRHWAILEGLGAYAVVGSVAGVGMLTPASSGLIQVQTIVTALGVAATALVLARRARRPVRDAVVIAGSQLVVYMPLVLGSALIVQQIPSLEGQTVTELATGLATALTVIPFAWLLSRVVRPAS